MRVLVTGGAGFIGANLVRALVARPEIASVLILDDLSSGRADNLQGVAADLMVGSILSELDVRRAMQGVDAVVHLAARPSVPRSVAEPVACHEINVTGTLNVLQAARMQQAHVIFSSSSSVYGGGPELPKCESMAVRPRSPYAAAKLAAESYTLAYQSSYDLDTLAFRFFNVYGPLQAAGHAYAAVIPVWIDACLRGQPLPVNGSGEQTRDFTHVGTVTAVLTDAVLRRVVWDRPVNLAMGSRTSLLELAEMVQSATGQRVGLQHRPDRVGDVRDSQADSSVLQQLFPTAAPLQTRVGIAETVAWFREQLVGPAS